MKKLGYDFFKRRTLDVAEEVLGKVIVFGDKAGVIVESEAYTQEDPASHTYGGRMGKRNEVMFKSGGHSYVYFTYGMHYCLNFVTEDEGYGAAVLLRGIKPFSDLLLLPKLDNVLKKDLILGPARTTKHFGIDKRHNGIDIVQSEDFYLLDSDVKFKYKKTPRIGISKAKEKLWRFVIDV
jgi:DNA-3-methyladenine glycosylase